MRARIPVRFGVLASVFLCAVAACTGDDEIYAVPKDGGPAPEGAASSSSSGGASSSSGGTGTPDGSPANDAASDGPSNDGGGDGGGNDASNDGSVVDTGVDSGPVTCSLVPCAANGTCTALGCGSCNLGLGFCKP